MSLGVTAMPDQQTWWQKDCKVDKMTSRSSTYANDGAMLGRGVGAKVPQERLQTGRQDGGKGHTVAPMSHTAST